MTTTVNRLILTAGLGICAVAFYGFLHLPGEEPAPAGGEAVEAEVSLPEVAPMQADLVPLAEITPAAPGAAAITYPDGTSYPTLNGVTTPVKLIWSSDRPYSPIVGKIFDGGRNQMYWYAHEDGSFSTTAMLQNKRGGPPVPTGIVQARLEDLPASMLARPRDK